jgi:D-beta-D-heptose 7-phosphate kinase/D-beta-D-heptose 1-phosphate adenosyltransferase
VRTGVSLDLAKLLARIGRPRIAVVGDAILDEYVWGEVERISPEAPIPVLRVARREFRAGGAGSVVSNLARLGAEVRFFSVRGGDAAGGRVIEILKGEGAAVDGVVVEEGRPTTAKTRHLGYVQHADRALQQMLRTDDEVRQPIAEATVQRIAGLFREASRDLDAILISDYHKGLISGRLLGLLGESAPGVPVLIDPALVDDYSPYRNAFLICPNRYEASRASGLACGDIQGCSRAAAKLASELNLGAVALTMDRDGIYLHEKSGPARHFPTKARVVADVTGAGDMVLSVLGLVVAAGAPLHQAVELSNIAAGIEVRRVGVTPLSREEILQEIRFEGHPGAEKIKKLDDLVPLARAARAAGKTVVLTNGCFDLLHFGHLHLLQGAAMEGDVLIVAVNSDASIRRLKGPGRPAIPEEDRLLSIAGLEAVDFVVAFEDDTPIPTIEALEPQVLVKGEEYQNGIVVGREVVEGYGGRVAFVSQIPGISTTALLNARRPG